MPRRSRVALKVNDLATSVAFYVERLGWRLAEDQPGANMAVILDPDDASPLLFAGPTVEDVSSHLDEPRLVFKPGDTLKFSEKDLAVRLANLTAHGLTDIHQEQTDEGDCQLTITDPSGYTIYYIQRAQRSPEETLARYAGGGAEIAAALAGLTEADFDLKRAPDEWSIRQIVHHLSETESLFLLSLKSAIAQSGSTYVRNPYDQAQWAEELAYTRRAIEPSLALINATHQHISYLLQHIPDYSERYILLKFASQAGNGSKLTVEELLSGISRHLTEHCNEIRETRSVHGR